MLSTDETKWTEAYFPSLCGEEDRESSLGALRRYLIHLWKVRARESFQK